jgi:hypothetical protein
LLEQRPGGLKKLLVPETLVKVGQAVVSTGWAASNTGIALHRLGVPTRLMGKAGDDILGARFSMCCADRARRLKLKGKLKLRQTFYNSLVCAHRWTTVRFWLCVPKS